MENCFVTKYKAVVNNDNLNKLGVIKLTATTDTNNYIRLNFNGEHIVKILNTNESVNIAWGGATKIDGHTVKVIGGTEAAPGFSMTSACDVVMEIEGKYDITLFDIKNVKDIKKGLDTLPSTIENITLLENSLQLDLSSVERFENAKVLKLGTTSTTTLIGTLDSLKNLTLLEEFGCMSQNNIVSGDISVLGNLTNLKGILLFGNKNVTGTLESFVAAQRTNGRTTESNGIVFGWGVEGVTFNGTTIKRTHKSTLTWTADTITYDDVTISA